MTVTLDITDDIAVVTMDDGKVNAISHTMLDNLMPALAEAESKAKAVVLAGRPGMFCAGFELKTMVEAEISETEKLAHRGGELVSKLFGYRKPIVAACTGHAMAIGGVILLACDTRIGEQGKFRIGLNETAVGVIYPTFGIVVVKTRVPPQHIMPAVIQAKMMTPETAVAASFLDRVSAEGQAVNEAIAEAQALAALPTGAYYDNKMALRAEEIATIRKSLETVQPIIRHAV